MTPDLQPLWQGDYTFGPSVLDEQLCEAEYLQGDALQARAATPSGLSRLRRLRASIASLSRRTISGDCFFLIAGAMVALDLVLVIVLVRR